MSAINKKKNIGIIFPFKEGGIFQYAITIAEALINSCSDFDYTIIHFDDGITKNFLKINPVSNVSFVCLENNIENKFLKKIKVIIGILIGRPFFFISSKNKKILDKAEIDLMILPSPQMVGFEHNIPFILPIPDMMYKHYQSKFPEYSSLKSVIISDVFFKYLAKKSALCVADSDFGKKDIVNFLGIKENNVHVIPFTPPGYINHYKNIGDKEIESILQKYNLPENFVFYPAQFWAHKNHIRLIKAISIIKEKYKENINIVLAGRPESNQDNYQKIQQEVENSNLKGQVFTLGYVSDQEIVALYKTSKALVFASVGGPTNIPLVEAMMLGTPVVCPNLFAMPEQVGKAGVLFDAFDENDMAEKIYKVYKDEKLRQNMIEAGFEQSKKYSFENYAKMWVDAVKQAIESK